MRNEYYMFHFFLFPFLSLFTPPFFTFRLTTGGPVSFSSLSAVSDWELECDPLLFLVRSQPREQDARLLREMRFMSTLMSNMTINLVLVFSISLPDCSNSTLWLDRCMACRFVLILAPFLRTNH